MAERPLLQKRLTQLFDIGIALKGLNGLLEVVGGIVLLLVTPAQMGHMAAALTSDELSTDPDDLVANAVLHTATTMTPHGQFVSIVFLLSHGLIKLFLVWQLFRGRLWAYPLTIVTLSFFIVYQIMEIAHGHSLLLTALTLLDALIIILAWQEYRKKKEDRSHLSLLTH